MRALIIGFGSIGQRHAQILAELGCEIAVVSRRPRETVLTYTNLEDALSSFKPEYTVIASATAEHYGDLETICQSNAETALLIEKPIFDISGQKPISMPALARVAYNLRFHPLIERFAEFVNQSEVMSIHAYAGQYLPTWRPQTDYRKSYSASSVMGGGVLLDLSHELDYLTWMAGDWKRISAIGGQFSQLEIDSDDSFSILAELNNCPSFTLHLNYLDKPGRRQVIVNTVGGTASLDLVKGIISINGEESTLKVRRDYTYIAMHKQMLTGNGGNACTIEEGLSVLEFANRAKEAALTGKWIIR